MPRYPRLLRAFVSFGLLSLMGAASAAEAGGGATGAGAAARAGEAGGAGGRYANPIFGYYEAIRFDDAMLQGVRVNEETGDVFIMFQPDKTDTQLTLKISQAQGAQYRKWFTGDEVLVAQENTGRAINTWTDRVQTSANYIEYHAEGRIFLHLRRIRD